MKRFALVLVLALLAPAFPAAAADGVGSAAAVFGTVYLQRGGKNYKLAQGTAVHNGDAVITQADSYAKLLMADESLITVGAKSSFRIERFQSSKEGRFASFRLFAGKVRAIVSKAAAKKNDVRFVTPTAVAGVRGTHLVVEFDKATQKTTLSVIEGSVGFKPSDASAGGEVVLGAKQKSEQSGKSAPSQPVVMSDAEVGGLKQDSPSKDGDGSGGGGNGGDKQGGGDSGKGSGEGSGDGSSGSGEDSQEGSGEPAGDKTETRMEENLNRVEQSIQQDQTPTEQLNPAVNPASDTGVRVRW